MSIKSLFEDIADAIREKSGSSDTYTPAEMPQAIANIPAGGGDAIIEEWDFKESLTGKNGAVATLMGNNIALTSNGVYISGASSYIKIPMQYMYNRKYTIKMGAFDFKGSLSSNIGIMILFTDSTGFLRRSNGYLAFFFTSWIQSNILLRTVQDINNYLTGAEITIELKGSKASLYINDNLILDNVSANYSNVYLTIGDKRSASTGDNFMTHI